MKKPAIWGCIVLALSISLGIVACTYIPPEGVYIQTFIEIYPGTKITKTDQSKLDAVLRKFDKSLYQIRKYEGGHLVETKGSLADALISQTLVTAIDKASEHGVSGSAAAIYYARKVVGWPHLPMNPALPTDTTPWNPKGKQLVDEVTPILAKYIKNYSHDQVANVGR
jgi:hypothetical protein